MSALASLGMGSLNHSTVQDLCVANVAVERLKAEPFLGVKFPHIPIRQVCWATVQDASWANAAGDHSEGTFLVGAISPGLWSNLPSPLCFVEPQVSLLKNESAQVRWLQKLRSCLRPWQRSSGFVGFFQELTNPKFSIVEWAARSRKPWSLDSRTFVGRRSEVSKSLVNRR